MPSFDLSRLLIGHTVLSSLAALYSNDVPQWNIPLALYGLATIQSYQITSESLSTFLMLFGGSVLLDLGRLVFGGSFQFFFFLNFLLKPLTLLTALGQLRQTGDGGASFAAGGMGDRIMNATSGFPPFGHRQQASTSGQNETVWSAPGSTAPPGSYQARFSLDGEDLESGTQPSDPLNGSHSRGPSASAPPTVQTQSKSFVSPQGARGAKKEGGGYHTLE
ncbi:hypothetical protein JCM5353_001119 [Sporobolomyces roseus]